MGSGGVAIAALPTVICLKVPFSDGLGGGTITEQYVLNLHLFCIIHYLHLVETHWLILENFACLLNHAVAQMGADM